MMEQVAGTGVPGTDEAMADIVAAFSSTAAAMARAMSIIKESASPAMRTRTGEPRPRASRGMFITSQRFMARAFEGWSGLIAIGSIPKGVLGRSGVTSVPNPSRNFKEAGCVSGRTSGRTISGDWPPEGPGRGVGAGNRSGDQVCRGVFMGDRGASAAGRGPSVRGAAPGNRGSVREPSGEGSAEGTRRKFL